VRPLGAGLLSSSVLTDAAPPGIHTLSLHDALPICARVALRGEEVDAVVVLDERRVRARPEQGSVAGERELVLPPARAVDDDGVQDRKSTRLNSSHGSISYAVFCLKKKTASRNYLTK